MKYVDCKTQIIMDSREPFIEFIIKVFLSEEHRGAEISIELTDVIKIDRPKVQGDSPEFILGQMDKLIETHPFYLFKKCESPIEISFFVEALQKIKDLKPQINIGTYRVDFAVPDKKIIIELDGHEFHKTVEQRTHDAKRDRYLIKNGWKVLRFTGSEINKDTTSCVMEAKEIIEQLPVKA